MLLTHPGPSRERVGG